MERLLTVAIPTYNRAALLDEQLEWFAQAVKGMEEHCELIVSDNGSSDGTREVVARWLKRLEKTALKLHMQRHPRNLGAIRNIASCLDRATGRHVWTVSDDDAVAPDTLRFVLATVRRDPSLSLIILNFSSRHWRSGKLKFARCYEVDHDQIENPGHDLFERILSDPHPSRWGGLVLTTALVYRTEVAQAALREWPEGLDNLTLQLYVTAFCARQGKSLVTKETYLEMKGGRHFFSEDRRMFFRFKVAEIPEAFVKLVELGYSRELCRQKILNQRDEIKPRLLFQNLLRGPVAMFRVLRRYRATLERLSDGRDEDSAPIPKSSQWPPSISSKKPGSVSPTPGHK